MKIRLIKILVFILSILFSTNIFAYDFTIWNNSYYLTETTKDKIDIFVKKKIYNQLQKIKYTRALRKINVNNLNSNKKAIYYYLLSLIDSKNFQINIKKNIDNKVQNNNLKVYTFEEQLPINIPIKNVPTLTNDSQKQNTINNLSSSTKTFISTLKNNVKDYVEIDWNFEFSEFGKIYRVKIKEYYEIDYSNWIEAYLRIPWLKDNILIRKWDTFILSKWWYSFEQKLFLSDLVNISRLSSVSESSVLFDRKQWNYIAYMLYDYKYIELPSNWVYISQLWSLWDLNSVIILQKWNKFLLVNNYIEKKLFESWILENIRNTLPVLSSFWKDLYFYKNEDYNNIMSDIKEKTREIVSTSDNKEEIIEKIYTFLTVAYSYDDYSANYVKWAISEKTYLANVNNEVFTWIWTFKNKVWVCDWFTKLLQYMLSFAWIEDVKIETWEADVWGWRIVSHAWINIWDKYYDPTWDINSKWDKSKFKWFWITQDEIYKTHFVK